MMAHPATLPAAAAFYLGIGVVLSFYGYYHR
jgi:hypothetical protein